ncbi:hypothetical protein LEP1GSC170_1413 [Leptospira interrogans serovar Bataviae str. HAI135]|nr:hypothetical protein LEP1GSC170_1413 [Leptospira interrogans serovar Bataviae str. HAI135]
MSYFKVYGLEFLNNFNSRSVFKLNNAVVPPFLSAKIHFILIM